MERGRVSGARPGGIRLLDQNGAEVDYTPSYLRNVQPQAAPAQPTGPASSPLSDFGARTLRESGLPSVRESNQQSMAPPPFPGQQELPEMPPPGPVPPPPGLPEWEEPLEVIDPQWVFDAFGLDDPSSFEAEMEIHEGVVGYWEMWMPCRDIRRAAYELVGKDPQEPGPEDAALASERSPGSGFDIGLPEGFAENGAKWLMAHLVADARRGPNQTDMQDDKPKLVRAMTLRTTDLEEEFFDQMRPGETVDIPLISTARNHEMGGKSAIEGFGTDVLLEFEAGSVGYTAGGWSPRYDDDDEKRTVQRISEILDEIWQNADSELTEEGLDEDDRDRYEAEIEQVEEIRRLIDEYEKTDRKERDDLEGKRKEIIRTLEDMGVLRQSPYGIGGVDEWFTFSDGEPLRWSGESISPEADSDYYYDVEYDEEHPSRAVEVITGGRFEVVSVERGTIDDPVDKPFQSKVRLRQVGVFDPTYPGKLVNIGGASEVVEVKALHVF
jgi:hypothetical protein